MNPAFLSETAGAFLRTLFAWQRARGRGLGIRGGQTGSVTFVQRFGGALQLFPHLHVVVPDGLFVPGRDPNAPLAFEPLPPPDDGDIRRIVVRVATRLGNLAVQRIEQAPDQPEWQWPKSDHALLYGAALEALRMPRQARASRRGESKRSRVVVTGRVRPDPRRSTGTPCRLRPWGRSARRKARGIPPARTRWPPGPCWGRRRERSAP